MFPQIPDAYLRPLEREVDFFLEKCDECGEISESVEKFNGLFVCDECREGREEAIDIRYSCAICGWPINRVIKKETVEKFLACISEWLEKNGKKKIFDTISSRIKIEDMFICRYDFFEMVEKIIEGIDLDLSKKFKKDFTEKFDFQGSIIS